MRAKIASTGSFLGIARARENVGSSQESMNPTPRRHISSMPLSLFRTTTLPMSSRGVAPWIRKLCATRLRHSTLPQRQFEASQNCIRQAPLARLSRVLRLLLFTPSLAPPCQAAQASSTRDAGLAGIPRSLERIKKSTIQSCSMYKTIWSCTDKSCSYARMGMAVVRQQSKALMTLFQQQQQQAVMEDLLGHVLSKLQNECRGATAREGTQPGWAHSA